MHCSSSFPTDPHTSSLVRKLKHQILDQLLLIGTKADTNSAVARDMYKRYLDQRMRHTTTFMEGYLVYLHKKDPNMRPRQLKETDAKEIFTKSRLKSMFEKIGHFSVINVQTHTVFIDDDYVRN